MSEVKVKLTCSDKCLFERNCAKQYKLDVCKTRIDKAMEELASEPTEEKTVYGKTIAAPMTDHNGKVTVSKGIVAIETKPQRIKTLNKNKF